MTDRQSDRWQADIQAFPDLTQDEALGTGQGDTVIGVAAGLPTVPRSWTLHAHPARRKGQSRTSCTQPAGPGTATEAMQDSVRDAEDGPGLRRPRSLYSGKADRSAEAPGPLLLCFVLGAEL